MAYIVVQIALSPLDTRQIYQRACRELLASYNKTLPEELILRSAPMETQEMAELICRKCKLPIAWENFLIQLNEHTCELIGNPPMMEGVERLVTHLHENCIGLGLITGSSREIFCKKIRGREEFFGLFDLVLCADEYNRPKPEPDCYLIAMRRLCDPPCAECCLAFDGTTKGVQAAKEARLKVIMLPEPELPCCWSELATQRLESLIEFNPEEFGMPYLEPLPEPPPPVTPEYSEPDHMEYSDAIANAQDDEEAAEDNEEPPVD